MIGGDESICHHHQPYLRNASTGPPMIGGDETPRFKVSTCLSNSGVDARGVFLSPHGVIFLFVTKFVKQRIGRGSWPCGYVYTRGRALSRSVVACKMRRWVEAGPRIASDGSGSGSELGCHTHSAGGGRKAWRLPSTMTVQTIPWRCRSRPTPVRSRRASSGCASASSARASAARVWSDG